MEQTAKICYKTNFPFGRFTNCMFKNLSTNKTETIYKFSVVQFENVILDSESQFFELFVCSNFSKTTKLDPLPYSHEKERKILSCLAGQKCPAL